MRIGRASSLAAAKAVSSRACRRTFWGIRVTGRSPAVWTVGKSSAEMPLMFDSNRPLRMWSVSPVAELQVDRLAAGQRVDQVGQEAGRHGRRAVGLDLAGHPVGDPDLEVRRGQLQAGVLGLEQDVREDRQRPVGDGPADDRQAAREVLLHDG